VRRFLYILVAIALIAMGALDLTGNGFDNAKAVIFGSGAFFWGLLCLLTKRDPWPRYDLMEAAKTADTHTLSGAVGAHPMWDSKLDGPA
jgi:hypothetical protein